METFVIFGAAALVVLNIIVLALYGADKWKAKKGKWRISENTLILGGLVAPVGAVVGMHAFHHKTNKPKFKLNYVFLVLHVVVLVVLYSQGIIQSWL